jgi:hypothetical protein
MILAAPVWTYWLAFWWLAADAVALLIIGVGFYRDVLRPRWQATAATGAPSRTAAASGAAPAAPAAAGGDVRSRAA